MGAETVALSAVIGFGCLLTPLFIVPGMAGETHITINFTETHDRLGPDPHPGIFHAAVIEATLTADGHVREHNVDSVNSVGRRKVGGNYKGLGMKESENEEKLGNESANVVWHVKGQNKLERLLVGQQFLMMTDIEIGEGSSCTVEIKYLLQKGHSEVIMRRRDTGEMAPFTLPKVVNSSCSIQ